MSLGVLVKGWQLTRRRARILPLSHAPIILLRRPDSPRTSAVLFLRGRAAQLCVYLVVLTAYCQPSNFIRKEIEDNPDGDECGYSGQYRHLRRQAQPGTRQATDPVSSCSATSVYTFLLIALTSLKAGVLSFMKSFNCLLALVVTIASTCTQYSASGSSRFPICRLSTLADERIGSPAHSTHAPLLKRATTPATLALEILPRQQHVGNVFDLEKRSPTPAPHTLRFDDSFRLTLSAFDEVFHLHLRPNDHLIHPQARINYYGLDADGAPTVLRTEPIVRETVKAYMGEVVASHHSPTRMREDTIGVLRHRPHPAELGWARIMVHHQGDADGRTSPLYEGAFSANGVIYHITTKENYDRKKHALDAEVVQTIDDGDVKLVIWRDSDAMTPEEEHFVKTGSKPSAPLERATTCAHDSLAYNSDPNLNPMLRRLNTDTSWLNHLLNPSPNVTHYRRDDAPTGDGGMGTK